MTKSPFDFADNSSLFFFIRAFAEPNTTKSTEWKKKLNFIRKRATTQRTYFHHFNFYSKKILILYPKQNPFWIIRMLPLWKKYKMFVTLVEISSKYHPKTVYTVREYTLKR